MTAEERNVYRILRDADSRESAVNDSLAYFRSKGIEYDRVYLLKNWFDILHPAVQCENPCA